MDYSYSENPVGDILKFFYVIVFNTNQKTETIDIQNNKKIEK